MFWLVTLTMHAWNFLKKLFQQYHQSVGQFGSRSPTTFYQVPRLLNIFHAQQLSMEFQMLIKSKMLKNDFSYFQMLRCCIYHAHKY